MHPLTNLNGGLIVVVEVSITAILHPDLHLVGGDLAYRMFDTVTGKAAANRTRYRRQNTAATLTNLIAQQAACHRTAYSAEPGGRLLCLDRVDRDDFTCIRVDGNGSR